MSVYNLYRELTQFLNTAFIQRNRIHNERAHPNHSSNFGFQYDITAMQKKTKIVFCQFNGVRSSFSVLEQKAKML